MYCLCPVSSCGSSQCYMTCSLLMLVEDARDDHMEEVYSRAGLMTKILCRYDCMYFLAAIVLVFVDLMVMSSA